MKKLEATPSTEEGNRNERQQRWDTVVAQVENFRDGLGMKVDAGIKETVTAMNVLGFKTRQSCEGHLERVQAAPWVDIQVEGTEELEQKASQAFQEAEEGEKAQKPEEELDALFDKAHSLRREARRPMLEEARKVMALLNEFYTDRQVSHDRRLAIKPFGSFFRIESEGAFLQDAADESLKQQKLREYQEEMRAFTTFLKDRHFASK